MDRALGAVATVGLSVVVLRLLAQAFKSLKQNGKESDAFLVLQKVFKKLFVRQHKEEELVTDFRSTETVLHLYSGSCHCRAVTFELAAPKTLKAVHGPGKISYAHTKTRACNFQFLQGTDHLQIYYVAVPAGSERGGVEPMVGAHTFCSQCGVHILHADSPEASDLHVNVCCVDGGSKPLIEWNPRNNNLSRGVPVANQWEDDTPVEIRRSAWGRIETEDSTLESFREEAPDVITQASEHSWKSAALDQLPGTPSTVGTIGTDSMRLRSLALDADYTSEDLEMLSTTSSRSHLPPLHHTSSSARPRTLEPSPTKSIPTTTTQMKYYLSKHLPPAGKKANSSPAEK
jgi:hypothetical protein